jgi:predicted MFS family arabinose efflux permease
MMSSKRMRLFLPQMAWTGASLAFYSGMLVPIITVTLNDQLQSKQFEFSMLCMVALGVGEMSGSLFIGQIIDRISSRAGSVGIVMIVIVMTVVTLTFLQIN